MNLRRWLLLGAVAVLLFGCKKKAAVVENFLNNPVDLARLSDLDAECTYTPGTPELVKKYVIIDGNTHSVDVSHQILPDAEKARSWSELKTLVLIQSTSEKMGVYKASGLPALRWTSHLSLIDVPSKTIVHKQDFLGGMPMLERDRDSDSSSASGMMPTTQIEAFLKGLPRR